jgi:hypothetical protein
MRATVYAAQYSANRPTYSKIWAPSQPTDLHQVATMFLSSNGFVGGLFHFPFLLIPLLSLVYHGLEPVEDTIVSAMAFTSATMPLTTVFTPAPTCTLPFLSFANPENTHIWGTDYGTTTMQRVQVGCYPEYYFQNDQKVLFSPGVCPSGHTMAQIYSDSGEGNTRAHCCPRSATPVHFMECSLTSCSNAPFKTDSAFAHCASPATSPGTIVIGKNATTGGSYLIVQKAIVVEWRSEDLARFTPASAPLAQSTGASPSVLPSSTIPSPTQRTLVMQTFAESTSASLPPPTTAPNTSVTSPHVSKTQGTDTTVPSPLSPGAKAGIGIGATVGGIMVLVLIAMLLVLRKKQAQRSETQIYQSQLSSIPRDLPNDGFHTQNHTSEAYRNPDDKHYYTTERPIYYELSPTRKRVELDGDPDGRSRS